MVEDALLFLWEEEKLARDVYATLGAQWDLRAFENIGAAEQRHMDRVEALLTSRGLAAGSSEPGVFAVEELAEAFGALTAQGAESLEGALRAGATIEELDLVDLERIRGAISEPDDIVTLDVLACGSRNHLRAFTSQLDARGEPYAPEHLDGERYAEILGTPHERCGRGW